MNRKGFGEFGWSVVVAIVFGLIYLVGNLLYIPYHTTDNGSHFGQVTAIEDNGFIWKTTTVYFKSDVSSSQEDKYCLDKRSPNYSELYKVLEDVARSKERVTLNFYSVVSAGWSRCDNEPAIISGVVRGD